MVTRSGVAALLASTPGSPEACSENIPIFDAWIGSRPYRTIARLPVRESGGKPIGEVAKVPRLAQARMINKATDCSKRLGTVPDDDWFGVFREAANRLVGMLALDMNALAQLTSRATGLPAVRVVRAWQSLAHTLSKIDEIAAAQSPDGTLSAYRTYCSGKTWMWAPAGRNLAVRAPANFPTININWLQALAFRRPVVLSAPLEDPSTALLLAHALNDAGLPDGALSVCYGVESSLAELADQVMWPGVPPSQVASLSSRKLFQYDGGRSKAILLTDDPECGVLQRLVQMVIQGCGRLCTNISGIIVIGDAIRVAHELSARLAEYRPLPLEHPHATIPAFVDATRARGIAREIARAVSRGGIDLTEALTAVPLVHESGGMLFLRPTLLVLAPNDPLFGTEFPFPFVTITSAGLHDVPRLCRKSLVVSVVGSAPKLVSELVSEPSIAKIFWGDQFDRQYDARDPHEGYIADFLFQKKAVSPLIE